MNKKLLSMIVATTFATTLTSCLPEEDTDTGNTDNTQSQTDTGTTDAEYDQLLDVVAQVIDETALCANTCHLADGLADESGLIFASTDADDVEAALIDYISDDVDRNSVKAKTVPAEADGESHTGGDVWDNNSTGQDSYEDFIDMIIENL